MTEYRERRQKAMDVALAELQVRGAEAVKKSAALQDSRDALSTAKELLSRQVQVTSAASLFNHLASKAHAYNTFRENKPCLN